FVAEVTSGSAAGALWAGLHEAVAEGEALLAAGELGVADADLHAGLIRQGRGVENDDDIGLSVFPGVDDPLCQPLTRIGVVPARLFVVAEEGNTGRNAVRAERLLQPGGVMQLADGDLDRAVALLDHRPGCKPRAGWVAGGQQRAYRNCRSGRHCQRA